MKMKEELYLAVYWYFRHKYADAVSLIEKENEVENLTTKNAEIFAEESIKELAEMFRDHWFI